MMNDFNIITEDDADYEQMINEGISKNKGEDCLFEEIPVTPQEFFENWLSPKLSSTQLEAVNSIFEMKDNELKWSDNYSEYLLLWGEGSGKDFICSRIIVYCAYYLMCMNNPQRHFSLASNEAIDLVNVSLSGKHAKNVFFYKLKQAIKSVRNPATGRNWFEEKGMDLRDSKDIKTLEVEFKKNIRAHSLNSQTYGGEGMNVLIAVFDEVGEFPVQKAKELYDNLKNTETSRFGERFKLFLISYMRHENDFMMYRWDKTKNDSKAYRSKKATWEVNPNKTREDFAKRYEENPEESARRFENKNLRVHENRFLQFPEKLKKHTNRNRKSPFIGESIYYHDLLKADLESWFRPKVIEELYYLIQKGRNITDEEVARKNLLFERHREASYYLHLDLAKGNTDNRNDCGAIAMVHKYIINPFEEQLDTEWGVYVDFMIQLRGNPEINFDLIRKFIYSLRDNKNFNIAKVTLDGYQSLDFQQMLQAKGMETGLISVDRSREPYETTKSLVYTNRLNYYFYSVFDREMRELEDIDGKIDHPVVSRERVVLEDLEYGSKDVSDAVAGATFSCLTSEENSGTESDWISV